MNKERTTRREFLTKATLVVGGTLASVVGFLDGIERKKSYEKQVLSENPSMNFEEKERLILEKMESSGQIWMTYFDGILLLGGCALVMGTLGIPYRNYDYFEGR